MSCKHFPLLSAGLLVIFGCAGAAQPAAAQTAATEPVAALRALHTGTVATRMTAIYDMGTRRLKRMLMARGFCTVPLAQRTIVCTDGIGLLAGDADIGAAVDGAMAGTKVVSVRRASAEPREIRYVFTRGPAGWQIDGIEAPGVADWAFAPLETPGPTVARDPAPAKVEPAAPVASAPMRRADRQRRLTRQN